MTFSNAYENALFYLSISQRSSGALHHQISALRDFGPLMKALGSYLQVPENLRLSELRFLAKPENVASVSRVFDCLPVEQRNTAYAVLSGALDKEISRLRKKKIYWGGLGLTDLEDLQLLENLSRQISAHQSTVKGRDGE